MDFLFQTWEETSNDLMMMASQIKELPERPNLIIAIARGGLVPARLLSDFLSLPVASYTVSSYGDLKQKKEEQMFFGVGGRLDGKHVLLVDDVSDTGMTFTRAKEYLIKLGAGKITTTAIFSKPCSILPPDVFARETDAWIIFPFDLFENLLKIRKRWREEGVKEALIFQRFGKMKIPHTYLKRLLLEP
jgi:hypoxanthine phosphoribosyltransferase